MDFLIKTLGLDKKVRQTALEYILYVSIAGALCLHLGGALIALGKALIILSGAIGQISLFANGNLGLLATFAQIKLKLASIGPVFKVASPDIHYCVASVGAFIIYLRVKLNHAEHLKAINAQITVNPPTATSSPTPTSEIK